MAIKNHDRVGDQMDCLLCGCELGFNKKITHSFQIKQGLLDVN